MSRKTTITGRGIRDETIEAIDIASGSIHADELAEQAISGQPTATAVNQANDRLLIWDADGSLSGTLKQVSPSVLGVTLLLSGAQHDGTQVSVSQPSRITFADTTGLFAEETATGQVKIEVGSHFNPITVDGQASVEAEGESSLEFKAGDNISITTDNTTNAKSITFHALASGSDTQFQYNNNGALEGAKVYWNAAEERLGIGTTDPQTTLHIKGDPGQFRIEDTHLDYAYTIDCDGDGIRTHFGDMTGEGDEDVFMTFGAYTGINHLDTAFRDFHLYGSRTTVGFYFDESSGSFGIGTDTPAVKLQIEGGTDASLSDGSGFLVMGDEDDVNMVIDNNEIIARNDGANSTLYLNAPGGKVCLGNVFSNAGLTIDSSGYAKFDKGWKYSPSVQVSSGASTDSDVWIKIASVTSVYQQKTSSAILLVESTGYESSDNRNISATFIIHVKFTASNYNPYYDSDGTSITVEPLDTSDLEGFNPASDIVLTTSQNATSWEHGDIWINTKVKDKSLFVTHLGGTSNVEVDYVDKSFWILSGQSWTGSYTSLGNNIVGRWVDKKIRKLEVTDSASITGNLTVDTNTLFVDSSSNEVGIGTTSPGARLHVKAEDARIRVDSDPAGTPGFELSVANSRKWVMYNGEGGDADRLCVKYGSDSEPIAKFYRWSDSVGCLQVSQIDYLDGDDAILIEDGGYLQFPNGVKASPGVKVNSDLTTLDDQWIKVATTPYSGDNYDISSSTFLITFVGVYYADSSPQRQRYMVSARVLADDESDPYYELKGTDILVTPLDADFLDGFDPTTDILLAVERDATPKTDIWIKARQKSTDVYVTHLNGSKVDTLATDVGWEILSGQNWTATTPDTNSYSIIYGSLTSRKMKNLYTTGAEFKTYTDIPYSAWSTYDIPILPWINEIDTTPDRILLCTDGGTHDGSGHRVAKLPAVANSDKRIITIKDSDGSANSSNIRVTGFSSETIDGATDHYIDRDYGAITVLCDGTEWKIISIV